MEHCLKTAKIIAGCIDQSEKHQELLYKRYYGYVMSISLTYSGEPHIAQEITDDSFLKVFSSIHRYNTRQPFKSWLRRISVNTAIDYYRKSKKYANHFLIGESIPDVPSTAMIDHLTVSDIYALIHRLPDSLKVVFNLYEIEGYSHQEIARALGISESSSRTFLMRAKHKLRDLYKELF